MLSPDAAEEFSSWARYRLFADDCAILRKFRGHSTIRTYLSTVLLRLFLDWRNAQWGRWRPSAMARRLGPLAVELERVVLRDGRTYEEALEYTLSVGKAVSRTQCDAVWSQLRRQPVRRMTTVEALEVVAVPDDNREAIDFEDAQARARRVGDGLRQALRQLTDQEQVILRLNYLDAFTAKQIGAALHLEPKPLYRRMEQIQARLGALLQAAGLSKEESLGIFRSAEVDLGEILEEELRKPKDGPSTSENAGGHDDE